MVGFFRVEMRIKSFICNPLKKRLLDFGWRLDDQHKMLIFGVASWLLIRIEGGIEVVRFCL